MVYRSAGSLASTRPLPDTGQPSCGHKTSYLPFGIIQRPVMGVKRIRRCLTGDPDHSKQAEVLASSSSTAPLDLVPALSDASFATALANQAAALAFYARRLTGQHADAEDLLQDTMLRCWTARQRFEAGTSIGAWARTVMRNSFLSGRRRARFQADLPEDALDRLFGVAETQSHAVELQDVTRAIGELTGDQRDAVLLASEGMTIEEAAAMLAIPEGTYKSRVARGRERLRKIAEEGPKRLIVPLANGVDRPRKRRDWKGVMIG